MKTETITTVETREFTVAGMSCAHCASSVRDEIAAIPAITHVDVDLGTGRLTVTGTHLDEDSIRAAVAEAGYELG